MFQHEPIAQRSGCAGLWLAVILTGIVSAAQVQLTDAQLANRLKGAWLGKLAGNGIGINFERMDPDQNRVVPSTIDVGVIDDACGDDDEYVQVPFLKTMDSRMSGARGIHTATMQDYGTAFRNTTFNVWIGNEAARGALQSGILPPYSGGQPLNGSVKNGFPEAIDWQIECHWIGWAFPSMPATAVAINDSAGHVISYACGLYAGRLFVTMEAIAGEYTDPHALVKSAVASIPEQSDIHKTVDSLVVYHDLHPDQASYWSCFQWAMKKGFIADGMFGSREPVAIVVIALLYCNNDIQKGIEMAARMGGDTDCNAGDFGAILGAMLGYSALPQNWRTALESSLAAGGGCDFGGGFTMQGFYDAILRITKKAIVQNGGTYANGVATIVSQPVPAPTTLEVAGRSPVPIAATAVRPALSRIGGHLNIGEAFTTDGRRVNAGVRVRSNGFGACPHHVMVVRRTQRESAPVLGLVTMP